MNFPGRGQREATKFKNKWWKRSQVVRGKKKTNEFPEEKKVVGFYQNKKGRLGRGKLNYANWTTQEIATGGVGLPVGKRVNPKEEPTRNNQ